MILYLLIIILFVVIVKPQNKTIIETFKQKKTIGFIMISIVMSIIFYIISIKIISSDIFNILNTDLNNYSIIFNANKTIYCINSFIIILFIASIIFILYIFWDTKPKTSQIITTILFITTQIIIICLLRKLFYIKNLQYTYIYFNYSIWRMILIYIYMIIYNSALLPVLFIFLAEYQRRILTQ